MQLIIIFKTDQLSLKVINFHLITTGNRIGPLSKINIFLVIKKLCINTEKGKKYPLQKKKKKKPSTKTLSSYVISVLTKENCLFVFVSSARLLCINCKNKLQKNFKMYSGINFDLSKNLSKLFYNHTSCNIYYGCCKFCLINILFEFFFHITITLQISSF